MGVEGGFVLVCEGVELAGEAMPEGVDAAAFFAVRGFGAGGFLGVLLVGRELRGGDWCWFGGWRHKECPYERGIAGGLTGDWRGGPPRC